MTNYNEGIGYEAAIPYNGIMVPPQPPTRGFGGGYAYIPPRIIPDEDEAIVAILLEILE